MDEQLSISRSAVRKLLGAANPDATLLYIYLCDRRNPQEAGKQLSMSDDRLKRAGATLRQLGLLPETPKPIQRTPEKPVYTEDAILREVERGAEFSMLVHDAQRRLGRVLSTEEMKVLLSLSDYLRLPLDVIALLINYCIQKNRVRGVQRLPSMRMIEKEAYYWADHDIDTLEDAAAYTQQQLKLQTQIGEIRTTLQLEDRRLTMAEETYVRQWLSWGFGKAEIHRAYEKTCLNKGALVWAYMNRILTSWHENDLHTISQIEMQDVVPQRRTPGKPETKPDSAEIKAAYERLLAQEG